MRHPDWKPLPPRYLGEKAPRNPAGASELLEDGFKGLGWVLGKLGKGLWWAVLGFAALVLLFTSPVGLMVAGVFGIGLYLVIKEWPRSGD